MRGDAAELPFLDASFDAVCCFAALNLFADPMRALDRMTARAHAGRADRDLHQRAAAAPRRCAPPSRCSRSGAARACSSSDELVDALEARGFEDVRQRIAGMTQFVGARRA